MKSLEALNEIGTISEILVDLSKSHITCEEAINEIRECNVGTNYGIIKQDLEELQALHDFTGVYDRTFIEYFKMYHEISQKHFLELVNRRKKMEEMKTEFKQLKQFAKLMETYFSSKEMQKDLFQTLKEQANIDYKFNTLKQALDKLDKICELHNQYINSQTMTTIEYNERFEKIIGGKER